MCFAFHAWVFDDVMISKKLKFDYLKNEKSFRSKIKNIFLVSQVVSFRHTKETNKNVADKENCISLGFDKIFTLLFDSIMTRLSTSRLKFMGQILSSSSLLFILCCIYQCLYLILKEVLLFFICLKTGIVLWYFSSGYVVLVVLDVKHLIFLMMHLSCKFL